MSTLGKQVTGRNVDVIVTTEIAMGIVQSVQAVCVTLVCDTCASSGGNCALGLFSTPDPIIPSCCVSLLVVV